MAFGKDLQDWLSSIYPLSEGALEDLMRATQRKVYARMEVLTQEGAVQREALFVEEGIQMSFAEQGEKLHVMAFTYAPSLSGIPDSFFFQRPSSYTLQALSPSVCHALPYTSLEVLYEQHRDLERLFRKMTEMILAGMIQRHLEWQTLSMEERFLQFARRSPHLFQLVPHKYLASYLNINATNFSKLYNKVKF